MSLLQNDDLSQPQCDAKRQCDSDSPDPPRVADRSQSSDSLEQGASVHAETSVTLPSLADSPGPPANGAAHRISIPGTLAHDFYSHTRLSLKDDKFARNVRQRLLRPDTAVPTFPRQAEAFESADKQTGSKARVFSFEISSTTGARSYMVASYERFWNLYKEIADGRKHYYEIIREHSPCHLYFDLEFDPRENPNTNGDALTDKLLDAIAAAAQQQFGLSVAIKDTGTVTELDSMTAKKWSRHLIVQFPMAAFATSRDCGAFVSSVLESSKSTYIVAKKGGTACFVDCSVYSRNRAFRLYLSSKAGKPAVLKPSERSNVDSQLLQRDIFMKALICNVESGCRLLHCANSARCSQPSLSSGGMTTKTKHVSSVQPLSGQQWQNPPCNHPGLDLFFSRLPAPDGTCGQIRSWAAVGQDVVLVSMKGTRWCGNVGRHHKSNGIYYVVDLASGTWWQKCYDYDCRHYRSEMRPLPPTLGKEAAQRANEGVLAEDTWTESEIEDAEAAEQATMVLYRSSGMLGSCEVSHNATD